MPGGDPHHKRIRHARAGDGGRARCCAGSQDLRNSHQAHTRCGFAVGDREYRKGVCAMTCPKLCLEDFEKASAAGEMFLAFQPKLNLKTCEIDGAEALARWQHPRKGTLAPARFVRSAELYGAIDWLTRWVLSRAIEQWSAWRSLGFDLEMAVNISALNLKHVDFPDMVERLCEN